MKKLKILIYGSMAFGLLILFFAAKVTLESSIFVSNAVVTNGTVVNNIAFNSDSSSSSSSSSTSSISYKSVIEFTTQSGNTITFEPNGAGNPPLFLRGESVELLYLEASPEKVQINDFSYLWTANLLLFGVGLLVSSFGLIPILIKRSKKKKALYLRRNGMQIKAKITKIATNRSITIFGDSPNVIHAESKNQNETWYFESDNIWIEPFQYIHDNDIKEVSIWIEVNNPEKYHMDISFLPEVK